MLFYNFTPKFQHIRLISDLNVGGNVVFNVVMVFLVAVPGSSYDFLNL